MRNTIALRLFALFQLLFEALCYAHDAFGCLFSGRKKKTIGIAAPDGTSRGVMDVTLGRTLSDLLPSGRELLGNSVRRGHANPHLFCGVSCDNYPALYDERTLADAPLLLRVAEQHAESIIAAGARRSSYLTPYVRSQLAHLRGCRGCRKLVVAQIREDARTRNAIKDLLVRAGMGPQKPTLLQ